MLVLTRKQNEKIQIGENITLTVVRVKGKSVRLGIEAPSNVSVLRGELVLENDPADIHCETNADQATSDTIIECRIPRAEHSQFVI